ncbi:MAG: transcriptional regulator [Pseudomonadota bacterium]
MARTVSKAARRDASQRSEKKVASEERLRAVAGFVLDDDERDFHKLLNDRIRLGVLSSLAVVDRQSFSELKGLLEVSDGNLSVHTRKLEEADYLRCEKSFSGRVPRSEFSITAKGKRALQRYLAHMEALIEVTQGS